MDRKTSVMDWRDHRSVQDKMDLEDLKTGRVRDDETPPEEMDRSRLSPRQMLALKAFHGGSSLNDAAKAASVSRQTLHRWRMQYECFSEAMENWEAGQMIVARSRVVDMANGAVDALANAIENGNAQAAMIVLKSLRILRTFKPLPAESAAKQSAYGFPRALPQETFDDAPSGVAQSGQGAAREQVSGRAGEQEKEDAPQEQANAPRGAGVRAQLDRMVATIAPAAQQTEKTSDRPAERTKAAVLTQKAGSAIRNACYSALQDVTEVYEMLHGIPGPPAEFPSAGLRPAS